MEYEIKVKVTEEQLSDLLETAFSVIGVWALDMVAVNDCQWLHDPSDTDYVILGKGVSITVIDSHKGKKKFVLNRKRLKSALSKSPWLNWDNWDSVDADRIVQIALFGEPVYA